MRALRKHSFPLYITKDEKRVVAQQAAARFGIQKTRPFSDFLNKTTYFYCKIQNVALYTTAKKHRRLAKNF